MRLIFLFILATRRIYVPVKVLSVFATPDGLIQQFTFLVLCNINFEPARSRNIGIRVISYAPSLDLIDRSRYSFACFSDFQHTAGLKMTWQVSPTILLSCQFKV
jgi:hypothetical protein